MNAIQVWYTRKASLMCREFLIARREEFSRGSKHKAGSIAYGYNRSNVRVIRISLESHTQVYSLTRDLERCRQFVFPYAESFLSKKKQ
jgi:hypothetical protein